MLIASAGEGGMWIGYKEWDVCDGKEGGVGGLADIPGSNLYSMFTRSVR